MPDGQRLWITLCDGLRLQLITGGGIGVGGIEGVMVGVWQAEAPSAKAGYGIAMAER